MQRKFTEQDTERYYDEEDTTYRSFWDPEGSLHWGYFDETTGDDFLTASRHLNDVMLARSGIDASSIVLDLGCGNGNTTNWLAEQKSCHVTGIDLSGVRVQNAIEAAAELPAEIASKLTFKKASATELPFDEGTFTHVWSQATIYHVHDKHAALAESYRVLKPGGLLVLDDLTKPNAQISAESQKHVYDRLLFDTPFSFQGYQEGLKQHGFEIVEAEDLAGHLGRSYEKLGEMAKAATEAGQGDFSYLVEAYAYMVKAVETGDLGWALYVCRK
jgi:ubiquinone/menaquinone biosynthesis C-methylase UbiE